MNLLSCSLSLVYLGPFHLSPKSKQFDSYLMWKLTEFTGVFFLSQTEVHQSRCCFSDTHFLSHRHNVTTFVVTSRCTLLMFGLISPSLLFIWNVISFFLLFITSYITILNLHVWGWLFSRVVWTRFSLKQVVLCLWKPMKDFWKPDLSLISCMTDGSNIIIPKL